MTSLRTFIHLLNMSPRGWLAGLLVLMLLASFTEGIGLLLLVPMLGVLGNKETSENPLVQELVGVIQHLGLPISVVGLLTCFLVLVGFRNVIHYMRERLAVQLQHHVVDSMRLRCFSALLNVEWRWIVAGRKSDYATLLLGDVSRVGTGLNSGLRLSVSLVSGIAYLATAFVLSWGMTVLALFSGGLVFWLLNGQRRAALALGQDLGRANRALFGNLHETLAGIRLTKIFGNEKRHLDHFTQTTNHLREQQLRFSYSTSLSRSLFQTGGAALLALYIYVGITTLDMPLPELAVLVMLFSRLVPLFMTSHQHYHHWLHAMPAIGEIDDLLAECQNNAEPRLGPINNRIFVREAISLDNVTFNYKGREQAALRNISLTIPARTTTAIMGASGSGKSTLADVLVGLLEPDSGQVSIDGKLLTKDQILNWRQSVAYVPQDVFLFHDSIRNNLLWAATNADEQQLWKSLNSAAADFVKDLPQGLDTIVGDTGLLLSGGERQRLALARALLKQPSLLVLDEATSALDTDNEARIRRAIENLRGNLTVVIIGHRMPMLDHVDKVVILDNGQITAEGNWETIRRVVEKN